MLLGKILKLGKTCYRPIYICDFANDAGREQSA